MKGHPIAYIPAELAWIEANRTLSVRDLHDGFCATFDRLDVSAENLHALRVRKGWLTGRTGRFERGQAPANKGKAMPYHPNSAAHRFKAGELRGKARINYKPVGTERVNHDGYLERKIHDGLPMQSRWRAVHLLRWEKIHGPLPAGMALKCLDGDRSNTDPENWEAIPRALLPRLNGRCGRNFDAAAPELRPTILAIAKLEHRARVIRKDRA